MNGRIEDTGKAFRIWKNPDLPTKTIFSFGTGDHRMFLEWGLDQDRLKIKSFIYPKKTDSTPGYTVDYVLQKAIETADCPNCTTGRDLNADISSSVIEELKSLNIDVSNREVKNMALPSLNLPQVDSGRAYTEMAKFWTAIGVDPKLGNLQIAPQGLARIPSAIFGLTGTQMGRNILSALTGFFGLVGVNMQGSPVSGNDREFWNAFFTNLFWNAADWPPGKSFGNEMAADIAKLKNAMSFGSPQQALEAFFKTPAEIQSNINSYGAAFGANSVDLANLFKGVPMSFGGSNVTPPTLLGQQRVPPSASTFSGLPPMRSNSASY